MDQLEFDFELKNRLEQYFFNLKIEEIIEDWIFERQSGFIPIDFTRKTV